MRAKYNQQFKDEAVALGSDYTPTVKLREALGYELSNLWKLDKSSCVTIKKPR